MLYKNDFFPLLKKTKSCKMVRLRLHRNRRCINLPLTISIFLLTVTLKIREKTETLDPLVIISSANQLTDSTSTVNDLSYANTSLVESGNNYTNHVAEEIPVQKPQDANQFILYQAIWSCLCSRRFMYPPLSPQNQAHRLNSSCSDEGTLYQPNQKVISMSMFVPSRPTMTRHSASSYKISLPQNLIKMRQHYPSYSLRIYTNASLSPNSSWCKLVCENEDLFWCDIRSTPSHGNLSKIEPRSWRFLVMGDPTVQIFHSRDLDSLISYREATTVADWLENVGYKAFQLMRDNAHHNDLMLGGMWGAQNTRLSNNSRGVKLREEFIDYMIQKKGYGVDQRMVQRLIAERSGEDVVAYDSYNCIQFAQKTLIRPFPVQREGTEFVGNFHNFLGNGKGLFSATKCPVECRPSYGKDWIYC